MRNPPMEDDDSYNPDDQNCTLFNQLDGNISLSSSILSLPDQDNLVQNIPVHIGHRPVKQQSNTRLPHVRKTIRRDNKVLQAASMPKMSCYNMRSLIPKIENFGQDMEDRDCSISLLTEVWEKAENKKHQYKIEELFEMRGLKYISTPRPGAKRGGGAAIVVKTENFSISKLNISIPGSLEIVWGLLRPVEITGKITKVILCCFTAHLNQLENQP
jgi:hypothetical protein